MNLFDGALKDAFGVLITMTKLKVLYIKNTHATATLLIGAAAATQLDLFGDKATDIIKLPPGGMHFFSAPDATGVVTSTNKNLKLARSDAGSITYDIIIVGVD